MKCLLCLTEMDPINAPYGTHPSCDMKLQPVDDEQDPFEVLLRSQIISMVRWAEEQNPRASQVRIGPSEIGTLCDRRVGYRLAETPACNTDFDPWASIVGTAIHSWLDVAVNQWMTAHDSTAWSTETALIIDEFVEGHADLYSHEHRAVIDWKSVGPDVMKKIKANGAPLGYQIQTHVYGRGFEQAGFPVERVCLVFLPRAGWLSSMYIWSAHYSPEVAEIAIERVRLIAQDILSKDILTYPHRWNDVEAVPSNDCAWCPWYNPGHDKADDRGCPGR